MAKVDRYTYRVSWSEEDGEFVGTCVEFPSLSWLDKKQEGALKGIRKLVLDCLKDMKKNGESLPEPLSTRKFTGELRVRLPPALHRALAVQAEESRTSLNRVIIEKLRAG
ncbi:MAG TPA: toxin-antitoxin system HicB family antitoxin [Polyangiaceae bacterium]|nr:toxin-antitoxin system HicB family antitoxin [Polyangiaceae bacterium]